MYLLEQDRNNLIHYVEGTNELTHQAVINNGMFHGINLYCDGVRLADYEDLQEVETEIEKINNYKYGVYVCNEANFSDYDEFTQDLNKMYEDLIKAYKDEDLKVKKMEAENV